MSYDVKINGVEYDVTGDTHEDGEQGVKYTTLIRNSDTAVCVARHKDGVETAYDIEVVEE